MSAYTNPRAAPSSVRRPGIRTGMVSGAISLRLFISVGEWINMCVRSGNVCTAESVSEFVVGRMQTFFLLPSVPPRFPFLLHADPSPVFIIYIFFSVTYRRWASIVLQERFFIFIFFSSPLPFPAHWGVRCAFVLDRRREMGEAFYWLPVVARKSEGSTGEISLFLW